MTKEPAHIAANGHTPGPWSYRPCDFDDWGIVRAAPTDSRYGYVICQARNPNISNDDLWLFREQQRDPYEANARLIAAAPELLAIAERLLDRGYVSKHIGEEHDDHMALVAAIAKAKGAS